MHQQPRQPPKAAPSASPRENPVRPNSLREDAAAAAGQARGSDTELQDGGSRTEAGGKEPSGVSKDTMKKLDQIIQNFHIKAAMLLLQSRMKTTTNTKKVPSQWFGLTTDEIDDFRDELKVWRTCGGFDNRPPPMIIETYLDASRLLPGQSLVAVDEDGNRWDVAESSSSTESSTGGSQEGKRIRQRDVILERWRVDLRGSADEASGDFGPILPTIYKRSIVFFRSYFVACQVLPASKIAQQSITGSVHPALAVRCRFRMDEPDAAPADPLRRQPLLDRGDGVTDYVFGDLETPAGRFYVSVTYRNECEFVVSDSDSLQSSRGMPAVDFKPTIPHREETVRRDSDSEMGFRSSQHRSDRGESVQQQTYGSLSTFHGPGRMGTSPISALRAVRPVGSDSSSPPASPSGSYGPEPPHSLPVTGHMSSAARPSISIRGSEGAGRRPSISFQPFKAGSLSGSPRVHDDIPASPRSLSRQSGVSLLAQARNRTSLTAGMASSLRGGPPPDPSISSSPKPSRFSSSFTHRRGKSSFSGTSRMDDDQMSSGKQSLSSSLAQPGSGLLAEPGGGSSSSFPTDDDNISEFLRALDSKKNLASFDTPKAGDSATRRTAAQLSKFHLMRDSNKDLTESMNSSMHLHRSSSSSSRQLTSVPGMVNPASISASSSPSKPLSPHTPHTPAIPSRLSENSIIDYPNQARASRSRVASETITAEEEEVEESVLSRQGTNAIDIPLPLSPRLLQGTRRSSSVAQGRTMIDDIDDELPFSGHRSLSVGADDRDAGLGVPFGMDRDTDESNRLQPPADIRISNRPRTSSSIEQESRSRGSAATSRRLRYQPDVRGRPTPPTSARGSFSGRYGLSGRGQGDGEADDEPLVFDMSELGREHNRRSLEEGRGGSSMGSGSTERGGYDSGRHSRRGW